jgi:hypothetical protein
MKNLSDFPRKSPEKSNIIDLFVLASQKTPMDVFREYWREDHHFIVTRISIPKDKNEDIIYDRIIVIGDFYSGSELKNKDVRLSIKSWNAPEWGFYVRPPQ